MALPGFRTVGFAMLACCAAALVPQHARAGTTDAVFITSGPRDGDTAHEVAPYDSEYAAAARAMGEGQNTPEADARPGQYYFLLGAHAFRANDFKFAVQMYEVAAAWAFKPAEYNLAIMYARGQGVPVDLPRALAWMALAAERNEKRYVDAREVVYAEMTKEQFDQANVIWRELKKTYGDEVALRRAKARWADVRAHMTGTRVGSNANPLLVGVPNAGMPDASPPKLIGGIAKKFPKFNANRSNATSPLEAAGGQAVDGSTAYRQLLESDNPYDPKFERGQIGIATVGQPTTIEDKAQKDPPSGEPDPTRQEQ